MQLSKRTLDILKNYSSINQSIFVKEGSKLSTLAIGKNIMADAQVEETFERDFAIYNLNEFLSAVSLFDKPALEFNEKFVIIREEGKTRGGLKYFFTNPALIVYPTKEVKMPPATVTFNLTQDMVSKIQKAGAVLGVNDVVVACDDRGISLVVQDKKNNSSNDFELEVSDTAAAEMKFFFKLENLKMLPGDYKVEISDKGISLFTSADGRMQYAIALEKN